MLPVMPALFIGHGNPIYIAAQRREGDPIELFNDRMEYGSIGMLSCRIG